MLFGLVAAMAALALLFAVVRSALNRSESVDLSALNNLIVTIDGDNFILVNGVAERQSAPGSAAENTVRLVGEPVAGDITGDGKTDAALVIRSDPGGSGTFYYAVIAVNDGGAYRATNVLALGDRIVPQRVDFTGDRFRYHYLDRKPDQSMADAPSVERTVSVTFDPDTGTIS